MLKKLYRKALLQIGILKAKPEAEIIELLKQNTIVREQEECDHKILSAVFPNDIWYRCSKCNQLWIITQAMTINANKLPELIKKFQKISRIKPKNIKDTKLNDYKKNK